MQTTLFLHIILLWSIWISHPIQVLLQGILFCLES